MCHLTAGRLTGVQHLCYKNRRAAHIHTILNSGPTSKPTSGTHNSAMCHLRKKSRACCSNNLRRPYTATLPQATQA